MTIEFPFDPASWTNGGENKRKEQVEVNSTEVISFRYSKLSVRSRFIKVKWRGEKASLTIVNLTLKQK